MTDRKRSFLTDFGVRPGLRDHLSSNIVMDPDAWDWPVYVDVTTGCNLNCRMCINSERAVRQFASRDMFDGLVRVIVPHADMVSFGCRHEALLHPDFSSNVARISSRMGNRRGLVQLQVLTSGTLVDRESTRELRASGIDWLSFSIETTDEDTYTGIRNPATWHELKERLRGFLDENSDGAMQTCIMVLMMRSTLPHLASSARDLGELGFRKMNLFQMVAAPSKARSEVLRYLSKDGPSIDRAVKEAVISGRDSGLDVEAPILARDPIPGEPYPIFGEGMVWDEPFLRFSRSTVCVAPWRKLRIDHEGYVYPCPFMLKRDVAWGNILEDSFGDIINGSTATDTRSMLLRGKPPNRVCARCHFGPDTGSMSVFDEETL